MKCLSPFEIEQYILSTPTSQPLEKVDHIAACVHCNLIYHALLEEQEEWSQALFEEKLPDSFTAQVMASIEFVELEKVTVPDRKRKNPKILKSLRIAMGAALLLVVLSAVILYSVPTLAETLRSLFEKIMWTLAFYVHKNLG
ncbi:hypothetical protein NYE25_04245 [Paenibacillus sp. FSL E2-8871]|uniref:hypothetical protein n=1 Tax=Paenibacillus sp. FSL E2-8871 TaxID=2975326 RepID=UPI0030FCA0BA